MLLSFVKFYITFDGRSKRRAPILNFRMLEGSLST